jgi:hypothetical protein
MHYVSVHQTVARSGSLGVLENNLNFCLEKCGYGNVGHRYNVSPIHLYAILGVGYFAKAGWFACAPTAY